MKTLHVTAGHPSGPGFGVARYATQTAQALSDLGHEVHLATSAVLGQGIARPENGMTEHGSESAYPFSAYNEYLQAALDDIPLAGRLAEIWKSFGPFDVLVAHDWAAGMAAAVIQRVHQCPMVGVMHGTEVGRTGGRVTREQHYVADMEKWFSERADRLVVPSGAVRAEVERSYGVDGRKISVIPGGAGENLFHADVDVEEFRGMFAEPDEKLVLFAGRLESVKGPDILIEAFGRVAAKRPRSRMAVAGEGSLRAQLMEQVDRSGLGRAVRFTGALGPAVMGALFQVSDVLVLSSRYEALGITAVEALLFDLPVIAFSVGGLPGLARVSNRIGLVAPGSVPDLAKAIATTLDGAGSPRERRPGCDTLVPKNLQWTEVARSYVRVFESLFVPTPR